MFHLLGEGTSSLMFASRWNKLEFFMGQQARSEYEAKYTPERNYETRMQIYGHLVPSLSVATTGDGLRFEPAANLEKN